jgi:hypothetical protein
MVLDGGATSVGPAATAAVLAADGARKICDATAAGNDAAAAVGCTDERKSATGRDPYYYA